MRCEFCLSLYTLLLYLLKKISFFFFFFFIFFSFSLGDYLEPAYLLTESKTPPAEDFCISVEWFLLNAWVPLSSQNCWKAMRTPSPGHSLNALMYFKMNLQVLFYMCMFLFKIASKLVLIWTQNLGQIQQWDSSFGLPSPRASNARSGWVVLDMII